MTDNHPVQWTGPGVGVGQARASTGRPRPLNGFALSLFGCCMDKGRKRILKRRWETEQQAKAKPIELPLPSTHLWELLDHLEVIVPEHGCNHTQRFAESWLGAEGHEVVSVVGWFKLRRMRCDCEIVLNIEPYLRQAEGEG
ncbi:MAG TPA: DUF2695 domain-containing protein [Tepidisphaeraceae bacterium]|jgi:hypothetical protein